MESKELSFSKKIAGILVLILVVTLFLVWFQVFKNTQDNLEIYFFDVGQGDATLIDTPDHHQILIDGGPDSLILTRLGEVMPFYDRNIDLVILTHPHADHVAGLIDVLEKYKVGKIWVSGVQDNSTENLKFLDLAKKKRVPIEVVQENSTEIYGGVKITNLYPFRSFEGQIVENLNNVSLVDMITYGKEKILFTGDIEEPAQAELVANQALIDADYLKEPHHGSEKVTTDFLQAVSPDAAIISVGKKNKYGHPSEKVLKILESLGIKIYRTDQAGTIKLETDGEKVTM